MGGCRVTGAKGGKCCWRGRRPVSRLLGAEGARNSEVRWREREMWELARDMAGGGLAV